MQCFTHKSMSERIAQSIDKIKIIDSLGLINE